MINKFFRLVKHPLLFRLFLIRNLPAAYFSGVRVHFLDEDQAGITVPYKWFSTNPFRSTYFACLAMAAEMSTGILAMAHCYKRVPAVSMLILNIEGSFKKKATGRTLFKCEDGKDIKAAIEKAVATKEPVNFTAISIGYDKSGEIIAEFKLTWGFKVKAAGALSKQVNM